MAGTRYALVNVLDLAVLLRDAVPGGKWTAEALAAAERVQAAPILTAEQLRAIPGGVRNERVDGANAEPTDPRKPLPLLEDFGSDGHLTACHRRTLNTVGIPEVAGEWHENCTCAARAVALAKATRLPLEREPARMVFTPSPPPPADQDTVRQYLWLNLAADHVAGWCNANRDHQPVLAVNGEPGRVWLLSVRLERVYPDAQAGHWSDLT